jgi:hypothetical protein
MTRRDCERILDVHQQLNRARDALDHGNWAGGRACSALLMSALILISELYNRCELAFLAHGGSDRAPSSENGQADPTAPPAVELAPEMTTVIHKQE